MRARSLTIPDARGGGASLRVTRHPERGKVVVSHWRDDVCVASAPLDLVEVPDLIGVLVDALSDGVRSGAPSPGAAPSTRLSARIRAWLRPRVGQIVDLEPQREGGTSQQHTG